MVDWSGKIQAFQVVLDNPSNIFFTGQRVEGRVMIVLTEEKKMKHLKIKLQGKGEVHWTEQRTRRRNNQTEHYTEHYRAEETYGREEVILVNGPSLPAGTHYIPFSLNLPQGTPSTYESQYGHVRYYLKATMVRDWKWDYDVKHHITVNAELDLNMVTGAADGGRSQDHKNLCCLCCKSGPITAMIGTDRQGYVPGELIAFSAEVDNQSDRLMTKSYLHLMEVVTYITYRKNKTTRRPICEIERGSIQPGGQDMWEDVKMRVPALAPTNLGGVCNIMNVQYELEFHVDPSGVGFDLVVTQPILVGTIPLVSTIPTFAPPPTWVNPTPTAPSQDYAPMAPPPYAMPNPDHPPPTQGWIMPFPPSAPPQGPAKYPDLPPPSYDESMFGPTNVKEEDDGEHTRGDWNFLPKYPRYITKY